MAAPSKKILGLTLLLSAVAFSLCQERDYRVEWERFEAHREVTTEYVTWHMARIGLTERSKDRIFVLNANYTVHKKLPKDAWVTAIAYQRTANNDYSMIPVRVFSDLFCDLMNNDPYFFPDFKKHSNVRECPIDKGEYFIRDFRVNEKSLPPELPGEQWKLVFTVTKNVHGEAICKASGDVLLNRYV